MVGLTVFLTVAVMVGFFFAPASVGGRASFAATSGTSMAPAFKTGDLVGLRKAGPVHVGDIAGYRSGLTGQIVVHRVIAEKDGRLTFKGDNNWWIDTYQPTQQEVIGKLWIHVSGAGGKLNSVNPGFALGGIGGVMVMALMGTGKPENQRGRRRAALASSLAGQGSQLLLFILAGTAVFAGALAIIAFRADESVAAEKVVTVQHTGTFGYSGNALPGPIYQDSKVHTGDPIYVNAVPKVTATFAYRLEAPGATDVRGTIRLYAVVRDIDGWEQTTELVTTQDFEGPDAFVSTDLELSGLMILFTVLEDATGSTARYYTTAITAEVAISGTFEGKPFESTFTPFYTLRVSPPNEIFVETSLTRDFESAPPTTSSLLGTTFSPRQDLSISVPVQVPATFGFVVADVRVEKVRSFAVLIAVGATLAALVVFGLMIASLRVPGARIQARYGPRLVRVAHMTPSPANAVSLFTMEDLVRVADRYQAVILWNRAEGRDLFTVQDGPATYVYQGTASAEA